MHRPFEILELWIKDGRLRLAESEDEPEQTSSPPQAEHTTRELSDDELFEHAMQGVDPLVWNEAPAPPPGPVELKGCSDEEQVLRILREFCRSGTVGPEQTREYVEHYSDPFGRLYISDLKAGRFAVQAHLDLHGFSLEAARDAVDLFVARSVRAGHSCVRIVHGRGRHSAGNRPLMKQNVERWLRGRRLSRRIMAYTSARTVDGGGGAVYVLLRRD